MNNYKEILVLSIILSTVSIFLGIILGIEMYQKKCVKVGVAEYYIDKEFKKQFRFKEIK